MIRHALSLVWNRKRANALVVLEIFAAFLVLFAVVLLGGQLADNARRPLGFEIADVWEVSIDTKSGHGDGKAVETTAAQRVETTREVFLAAQSLDEVASAARAETTPYGASTRQAELPFDGRTIDFDVDDVSDDFARVMGLEVVEGRWFGREDDGNASVSIVLNAELARRAFPGESAVGKTLVSPSSTDKFHVVGVISDYRRRGEYGFPGRFVLRRARLDDPKAPAITTMLVRTRAGTPHDFEERLVARLRKAAPEWSFVARPLVESRASALRLMRAPLIAFGVVAIFLVAMVGLGLSGVMWQNVTQRTREIGLRRALGATVRDIHRQILGELFVITSFGVGLGVAVAAQIPLLDVLEVVRPGVYAASLAGSAIALTAIALACGVYPSRIAAVGMPAEALRDE